MTFNEHQAALQTAERYAAMHGDDGDPARMLPGYRDERYLRWLRRAPAEQVAGEQAATKGGGGDE
jgi:hypothetical protein